MFRTFDLPLTWADLFKRTMRETSADDCLGLAAQLAYYFLLALAPTFVCLVALASFFPATRIQEILAALGRFAPDDVLRIMREQLVALQGGQHGGVFTLGLALALWGSSAAMVGITDALNRAYDIEEGRPWWKVRLTAIALTIALAVFVVVALGLVMIGPTFADHAATTFGLGPGVALVARVIQWPIAFALVVLAIGCINYFAPDAEQDWEWITPGAVLATVLWLLTSLGFKFYIANFANYNETYGSLGGVIILMLWFYLSGLAILVGAEMNAEIEHASPHGKDPGEKVPGEKRKIGAAAARAYEERIRHLQPAAPRVSAAAYAVLGIGLVANLFKKPVA